MNRQQGRLRLIICSAALACSVERAGESFSS